MTAQTTVPPESSLTLTGELLDALIEAVVVPRDPRARSAVICTLVHEMCATVERLQRSEAGSRHATEVEMISVRRLAAAAQDYRLQMAFGRGTAEAQTV